LRSATQLIGAEDCPQGAARVYIESPTSTQRGFDLTPALREVGDGLRASDLPDRRGYPSAPTAYAAGLCTLDSGA